MPKHISDFSEYALERDCEDMGYCLHNYSRNNYSYGCTVISYSHKVKTSYYIKAAIFSFGMALPSAAYYDYSTRHEIKTHYFFTKTGEELGSSKEEAIKRSASLGEEMMKEKKYSEARSYFNVAYHLCSDSREKRFKDTRDLAEEEMRKENEEKERREREEKERKEREKKERERQERERREKEERKQDKREREAKGAYQNAQKIWSEAFILENNNSATDANHKFEQSNKLFEKATTLMPHVTLYRNWFRISSLKLEGDSLFNEGVTLQEQGNILRGKQKYVEALQKYGEALNKYKEGYEMSKDSRFEACIEFVESCIREVDEIIQEGDVVERLQRTSMGSTEMNLNNSGDRNETLILHQVIDS